MALRWASSICLSLSTQCLWWDVVGCWSPGLCVPGSAFLQPEAASHPIVSVMFQLTLPGSAMIGGAGGSRDHGSEALFFPMGLMPTNTDHLGWNTPFALSQYAE